MHDSMLHGDLRWLRKEEGELQQFRSFMKNERDLDDRFQQTFMMDAKDPRREVLTNRKEGGRGRVE